MKERHTRNITQTDRQKNRQRNKSNMSIFFCKQLNPFDIETDRQSDRQSDRQTDRQTDRQGNMFKFFV